MRQGQFFFVNISARFLNISNSSNFIPNFVLLISRLPDIAQKTACTRNEALDVTFQMKYVLVLAGDIKQKLLRIFLRHPV